MPQLSHFTWSEARNHADVHVGLYWSQQVEQEYCVCLLYFFFPPSSCPFPTLLDGGLAFSSEGGVQNLQKVGVDKTATSPILATKIL